MLLGLWGRGWDTIRQRKNLRAIKYFSSVSQNGDSNRGRGNRGRVQGGKTSPGYPIGQHFRPLGRSEWNGLSRGSDLFSPKLLDPSTHSLSRLVSEIQNDIGILIEIKDGKVFLGIDNDGILA